MLEERFIGSPLRRAKGVGLRRNAMIVAANIGATELRDHIESVLLNDPDPVLRRPHGSGLLESTAAFHALEDDDEMVRDEVQSEVMASP